MRAKPFNTTIRIQDGMVILDLHGELNAFAEDALKSGFAEAGRYGSETILTNFRDVSYINSTGIALIVGLLSQARALNRKLLICGLSDHYVQIFKITRLSDYIPIYEDEHAALTR